MSYKKIIIGIIIIVLIFVVCTVYLLYTNSYSNTNSYSKAKAKLFEAIKNNNLNIVSELLIKYPKLSNDYRIGFPYSLLVFDATNNTPIMEACTYGRDDMVVLLVENGADINNISLCSAIKYPIIEVLNNDNYDMAWYFIEHNADLDVKGDRDNVITAILNPIQNDNEMQQQYKLIKYFIDNNLSLDLSTALSTVYDDNTVFDLAVFNRNILVVEYLLDNNMFDVNACVESNGNFTALHLILKQDLENKQSDSTFAYFINSYDMCKLLIEHGADATIKDDFGKTAYDYAVELGDEYLISMLA